MEAVCSLVKKVRGFAPAFLIGFQKGTGRSDLQQITISLFLCPNTLRCNTLLRVAEVQRHFDQCDAEKAGPGDRAILLFRPS